MTQEELIKLIPDDTEFKGQIKDFPVEVVRKMVEMQVEQGNQASLDVFEDVIISDYCEGGFSWEDTEEGRYFWYYTTNDEGFQTFFKKYPKENKQKTKQMTKSELKMGMRVTLRDGEKGVVMLNTHKGNFIILINETSYIPLSSINEGLCHNNLSHSDVVEVHQPALINGLIDMQSEDNYLLWQREEAPEYTMEEAIEKMGHEFKIKK